MWSKFVRWIPVISLLLGLAALGSCFGGGEGTTTVTLEGTVRDEAYQGATVNIYKLGDADPLVEAATSDATGGFSLTVSGLDDDDVLYITAEASGTILFKSILGRWGDIRRLGSTVTSAQIADLIVSHLSTAKVGVVEAVIGDTLDDETAMSGQGPLVNSLNTRAMAQYRDKVLLIAAVINRVISDPNLNPNDYYTSSIAYDLAGQIVNIIASTITTAQINGATGLFLTDSDVDNGLAAVETDLAGDFSGFASQTGTGVTPITDTSGLQGPHYFVGFHRTETPLPAQDLDSLINYMGVTVVVDSSGTITDVDMKDAGDNSALSTADWAQPDSNNQGLFSMTITGYDPDVDTQGQWYSYTLGNATYRFMYGTWSEASPGDDYGTWLLVEDTGGPSANPINGSSFSYHYWELMGSDGLESGTASGTVPSSSSLVAEEGVDWIFDVYEGGPMTITSTGGGSQEGYDVYSIKSPNDLFFPVRAYERLEEGTDYGIRIFEFVPDLPPSFTQGFYGWADDEPEWALGEFSD